MKPFSVLFRFLLLTILILGVSAIGQPAKATTLSVCPSGCAYTTIAAAINAANDGDTITIGAGTYLEHDLFITKSINLVGAGSTLVTVDAYYLGRIFYLNLGITVSISGMTLTHGRVVDDAGGAIVNPATLSLDDVNITNNSTVRNTFDFDSGGGIFNSKNLTMTNSRVTNNHSVYNGSGIQSTLGTTTHLTNVVISDNFITGPNGSGGGIAVNSGTGTASTVYLDKVTVNNNSATSNGGGIWVQDYAAVTITNSTISNNQAEYSGGIEIDGNSSSTLTNDTISGNEATNGEGGGITFFGAANDATLTNVTIAGNTATTGAGLKSDSASIKIRSTILAGNIAPNSEPDCLGTVTSLDYNLIQDTTGCIIVGSLTTHNITGFPAGLGPLGNYGGPTQTMALLPSSRAIDTGANLGCPSQDQRGVHRIIGAACDIGAYEASLFLFLPLITR